MGVMEIYRGTRQRILNIDANLTSTLGAALPSALPNRLTSFRPALTLKYSNVDANADQVGRPIRDYLLRRSHFTLHFPPRHLIGPYVRSSCITCPADNLDV